MPFAWAAGAAAVGSIAGAAIQSSAVSDAQDSANAEQRSARDQAQGNQAPYMNAGRNALMQSGDLLGLNGQDAATAAMGSFQHSPGYAFQLSEGLRAVNAGASRDGMLGSGATLKALQDRGNQLASIDFNTYYNRLAGIVGLGQNAAAGVGNAGIQTAKDIAQTDVSAAGAQASIYGNAASGVGNQANNFANNSLYQQKTNALMLQQQGSQPGMAYGDFSVNRGGGAGISYEQLSGGF